MKKLKKILAILIPLLFSNILPQKALTSERQGGRLGDQLMYYARRKVLQQDFNLTLYERPFAHSNKFILHRSERKINRGIERQYRRKIKVKNASQIANDTSQQKTLYIANFYTRTENPIYKALREPVFAHEIKKMLTPTVPIEKFELPKNKICVAVHVRKGSGHDPPLASPQLYSEHKPLVSYTYTISQSRAYADQAWPTKFPPDQYYIDQIKKLSEMIDDKSIYVYLFTDYNDPQELCNLYKKNVGEENIIFDYNRSPEYKNRIIHDLFNMAEFDCLIRGESNFSQVAQLIGNHKIVFFPIHTIWQGNKLIIDKVGILQKNDLPKKSLIVFNKCKYECNEVN